MLPCAKGRDGMGALDGLRIAVTRPAGQAVEFAALLQARGAVPVLFPTIDIAPLADCAELDAALAGLGAVDPAVDLVVFVSANAVFHAFERLARLGITWPRQVPVAATGPATAAQLAARGIEPVIRPRAQFDSEGLVGELDRLGLAPRRVLIVRGEGGREWLLDHLAKRGATVRAVASYKRVRGSADAAPLLRLAAGKQLAAITVTSSEGGENLMAMLGPDAAAAIKGVPMFVPHRRIAARMRALDCTRVVETAGGDAGVLAGLQQHFAKALA